jgi:hypothetical protein
MQCVGGGGQFNVSVRRSKENDRIRLRIGNSGMLGRDDW